MVAWWVVGILWWATALMEWVCGSILVRDGCLFESIFCLWWVVVPVPVLWTSNQHYSILSVVQYNCITLLKNLRVKEVHMSMCVFRWLLYFLNPLVAFYSHMYSFIMNLAPFLQQRELIWSMILQAGTQFWDEQMATDLAEGRLDGTSFDRCVWYGQERLHE